MKFKRVFQCELPFVLNIPPGLYDTAVDPARVQIEIKQEYYAQISGFGDATIIPRDAVDKLDSPSCIPLKTLACSTSEIDIEPSNLDSPRQDEVIHEVVVHLIRHDLSEGLTGQALTDFAQKYCDQLSPEIQHQFGLLARIKLNSNKVFNRSDAYVFVKALNALIRKYSCHFGDFFVEEITLHQLSGTVTKGVHVALFADSILFDNYHVCEKIPPLMRRPWQGYTPELIESFRIELATTSSVDAIKVLEMRSRYLAEVGAYRSCLIEANAMLETAVAKRIRTDYPSKGKSAEEIADILKKSNNRFDDRCKSILRDSSGFTFPGADNVLWEEVKRVRDEYRHKISHSEIEPSKTDTEAALETYIKATNLVLTYPTP